MSSGCNNLLLDLIVGTVTTHDCFGRSEDKKGNCRKSVDKCYVRPIFRAAMTKD